MNKQFRRSYLIKNVKNGEIENDGNLFERISDEINLTIINFNKNSHKYWRMESYCGLHKIG